MSKKPKKSDYDVAYEWHCDNDTIAWYGKLAERLGYSPSEFPASMQELIALVHPKDKERFSLHKRRRVLHASASIEYRIRTRSSGYIDVHDYGTFLFSEGAAMGVWIGLIGCIENPGRENRGARLHDSGLRCPSGEAAVNTAQQRVRPATHKS